MPRISCWFIRMALLHLAVGVLLGGLILSAKGQPTTFGWAWRLLPAHIQLLVGGWLTQLALGMATWILPRLAGNGERGRMQAAWASFGCLNGGVFVAAVLLALHPFVDWPWLVWLLPLAGLAQVLGLAMFVWHAWPRLAEIKRPEYITQN